MLPFFLFFFISCLIWVISGSFCYFNVALLVLWRRLVSLFDLPFNSYSCETGFRVWSLSVFKMGYSSYLFSIFNINLDLTKSFSLLFFWPGAVFVVSGYLKQTKVLTCSMAWILFCCWIFLFISFKILFVAAPFLPFFLI